jgi:hypothetical protein
MRQPSPIFRLYQAAFPSTGFGFDLKDGGQVGGIYELNMSITSVGQGFAKFPEMGLVKSFVASY